MKKYRIFVLSKQFSSDKKQYDMYKVTVAPEGPTYKDYDFTSEGEAMSFFITSVKASSVACALNDGNCVITLSELTEGSDTPKVIKHISIMSVK